MNTILNELISLADSKYREFHSKLIPTIDKDLVLGVRSPVAQGIAKKYVNTEIGNIFLNSLPHKYYDENIVHAFMLGKLKCDQEELKEKIVTFLPHVDNWAVCDGLCAHLKRFFKNPNDVYGFVLDCVNSDKLYTQRFGLVCLLSYYIDKDHIGDILEICKSVKSQEYYVNMAVAWLISFCLIKEYDSTLPLLEEKRLDKWVHNKSIQKACESYQVSKENKTYLRSLKIKQPSPAGKGDHAVVDEENTIKRSYDLQV